MPADDVEPIRKDVFPELTAAGDPALRIVAWLIRNKDFRQLEQRTGIRRPPKAHSHTEDPSDMRLPVVIRLGAGKSNAKSVDRLADEYKIPPAYREEMKSNRQLTHATALLPLGDAVFKGSTEVLVKAVTDLQSRKVTHVSLGAPGRPSRARKELGDIGMPNGSQYKGKKLSGKKVIVGIIDDGCAFANVDFLEPRAVGRAPKTRILYLWDQAGVAPRAGWTTPVPGAYGLELDKATIDAELAANLTGGRIDEETVYRRLGYPFREVATHGSHVMGIAAGTGQSIMGTPGVAPKVDLIFVQLPLDAIEGGATVLRKYILDGVAYIFARAGKRPAVVNISYGGYDGPHDGTSTIERTLDQMLNKKNRAVVLAAGNGFEARCHATTPVPKQNKDATLRWIIGPCDPTPNTVEFWYEKNSKLQVRLRSPGPGISPAGWIQLGQSTTPITRTSDGRPIGTIEHLTASNGDRRIVISLNATDASAANGAAVPAPSGTWQVDFKHIGGHRPATVHGWIWRDDSGRPREARLRQSRFHPDDAHPSSSIGGWSTGTRTISVGAYNEATSEVCSYSACGPTRDGRAKPEIYAPAEDDARGRGILSVSARSARPRRMNGTSVSAPYITGMIALLFEYAQNYAAGHPVELKAEEISQMLKATGQAPEPNPVDSGKLRWNRRQAVDGRVRVKQSAVKNDLLSTGKADFDRMMRGFFDAGS